MHINNFRESNESKSKQIHLYPHEWSEAIIVFFYGSDYDRSLNRLMFSNLFMANIWNYGSLIMIILIVFITRRIYKLRRDGISSCVIDIMVTVVGGGRLPFSHRSEKWIFSILLIAGIFINAIGIHGILFPSFINPDRKISTFEELARVNPPIYITRFHEKREAFICDTLRFGHFEITR